MRLWESLPPDRAHPGELLRRMWKPAEGEEAQGEGEEGAGAVAEAAGADRDSGGFMTYHPLTADSGSSPERRVVKAYDRLWTVAISLLGVVALGAIFFILQMLRF